MTDFDPNFRALCTELAVDLEEWMVATDHRPASSVKLVDRARAALATPPPGPPTDDELYEYWISTSPEFGCADPVGFSRAVLERWGRLPAIEPVPVNWGKLTNQQVMKIAPVSMPLGLTGEEETAYCAGFRRCAQAIGSAIEPVPVSEPPPEPPTELPSLLTAALKLREENDLSHLFMPKLSPPPEQPTGQIIFNAPPTEEVIRLDKEGFHYKGQFIADAGEAHRLMLAFLKQHAKVEPEPPTDEELLALKEKLWDKYKTIPYQWEEFMYSDAFESALSDYRAVLERRGK